MTIFIYLILIFVFSLLLIKATDILLVNYKSFSRRSGMGKFALTAFLMALATSLPELFVGVTSALEGAPNLSLGNVIGANIANLSLVIGGAALVGGSVKVQGSFMKKDVFYAFLAGAAPMVLLFDKTLGRADGLVLLALYGFYNTMVLRSGSKKSLESFEEEGFVQRVVRRINHCGAKTELAWIFLGLAMLIFSAEMIVKIAVRIAVGLNIPILLVGLFLVSVGTTLPELAFGVKALKNRQAEMVFGNLLGSIVANGTLVIGVVSLISPIKIAAFDEYLLATLAFVIIFGIFYLFIRTKKKLERWEGAVLLVLYLAFILVEFMKP